MSECVYIHMHMYIFSSYNRLLYFQDVILQVCVPIHMSNTCPIHVNLYVCMPTTLFCSSKQAQMYVCPIMIVITGTVLKKWDNGGMICSPPCPP